MFSAKNELFTVPSGYQISRSVRFRNSATAYLSRSPASSGDQQKMTFSFWVKRGQLGTGRGIYCSGASGSGATQGGAYIQFPTADTLSINQQTNNAYDWVLTTTQVFRDPSAWYHIVLAIDTTQATSSNRVLMYVNGVQVTAFSASTYPTLNLSTKFNSSGATNLAATIDSSVVYIPFDGYMTEVNFVNGQALTPSSFGEYDAGTGVWKPKKYTGTYGTNGFYLNFSDNSASTAATIGKDYSGNGNNWTPNNISVTAGVTYDSMLDVPTPFPDGGNGRGNYAVMNPIFTNGFSPLTLTNGNLTATSSLGARLSLGTMYVTTNAYYFEATCTTVAAAGSRVGIRNDSTQRYYDNSGNYFDGATSTAYGATYTTGDVIGVAFDLTNQTITFYKNNTSQGQKTAIGLTGILVAPFVYADTLGVWNVNFGQRPFIYTPPSGFKALNTQNLPTPTIANGASYMAATTYTGTGAALTIANSANNTIGTTFQPDFVWIKGRSGATDHALYDVVRGTTKDLVSNTSAAETTQATGLTAFGSTGFTIGALAKVNTSAATYVGWQWLAGNSSGSSNTNGSITSTVSANTTAGFSVVTYTGTGATATVGHGLGVAPNMLLVKKTSVAVANWAVYHSAIGNGVALSLNQTTAQATNSAFWQNTTPTSTVFSVGSSGDSNPSGATVVAYCFAAVAGYSAFGSYTGNGSTDGPFIYTGFRPRFVLFKKSSAAADNWEIIDTSRNTSNVNDNGLAPNSTAAEISSRGGDVLSNGFKLRFANGSTNESGFTYIYMAFAENPFKYSLAR